MMSSEEDITLDSYGLLQKSKRSRRVDAGEPRNSYSSIPNFSSRPNLLNSGIYGAFLAAGNHHPNFASPVSYFNSPQAFNPKMLNELLGRRTKSINETSPGPDTMMSVECPSNDLSNLSAPAFDCLSSQSPASRLPTPLNGLSSSPPTADMAQHMLRNILQGRKKDIFAMEQELKGTGTADINNDCSQEPNKITNNNNCNTSNNNHTNEAVKPIRENGPGEHGGETNKGPCEMINGIAEEPFTATSCEKPEIPENQESSITEAGVKLEKSPDCSDSERSDMSPDSMSNKDESEDLDSSCRPDQTDLKRARVENIVSSMHSSTITAPVNGCKKRKLYHPQQHDNGVSERFALNDSTDTVSDFEDENPSPPDEICDKKTLETKLKIMQDQLTKMQQTYKQLYAKANPNSPAQAEVETSDIDPDNEPSTPSLSKPQSTSPTPASTPSATPTPVTNVSTPTSVTLPPQTQPVMTPAISKMLNSKFMPQTNSMHTMGLHSFPLHPNLNSAAALSILHQQMIQEQQMKTYQMPHTSHHHTPHHHPSLGNAAAMYLGANQKLFMDHEVRMVKDVEAQQQQQLHQTNTTQIAPPQSLNHSTKPEPISPAAKHIEPTHKSAHSSHNQLPHLGTHPHAHSHNNTEFSEHLQRLSFNASHSQDHFDPESLAAALKTEISNSLSNLMKLIDRFVQTKRHAGKGAAETAAVEQLNKDLILTSSLLDRKSPRTKVIDRGNCGVVPDKAIGYPLNSGGSQLPLKNLHIPHQPQQSQPQNYPENNPNAMNLPSGRPGLGAASIYPPKLPSQNGISNSATAAAAAAAIYTSINQFCLPEMRGEGSVPEQNEALSLVVAPKKKRHKVTDTRITPRTVSRILAQDGLGGPPSNLIDSSNKFIPMIPTSNGSPESTPPRPFHVPPTAPMLPPVLPTSVAITNPSLQDSQVFSPYGPFYGQPQPQHHLPPSSPSGIAEHLRDSPPLHHSPLFHPALLAAAQQQQQAELFRQRVSASPDFMNSNSAGMGDDPGSECASMEYDGLTPTSSTLSPMHLRKAKLMFFWVRYPSSAVLKMYFPDIKFNKNNTAQLVKWFSNFREFYYIQMEKYARAAMAEGTKTPDELHVTGDCELYRILNLHYNRNNHIEVPQNFKYVVEQTLKEFFKAIQTGKDTEQSWKKSIYKVISRLDDPVPEYFKTPNFLEQLE